MALLTDEQKAAKREYARAYYAANREKLIAKQLARQKAKYARDPDYFKRASARRTPEQKARWRRNSWIRRRFGLAPDVYDAMLAAQKGRCLICGKPFEEGNGHALDHCHRTGKLRGFLCKLCNSGIGWFQDSAEWLENAAAYLRMHE